MSRFWGGADSSSEESRGSDSDSDISAPVAVARAQGDKKFGRLIEESDSDSDSEVRVVKSQKDRKWDSIREGVVRIRNAKKNSDWPLLQDEFAKVNRMIEKSRMLILQSGLPPFYIKLLAEIEDHVTAALKDKEAVKKLKPAVSRSLNQMKLQVKRHNESYREQIEDLRANPEKYEEVEEEEDEDDDDSDSNSDSSSSDSDSDSGAAAKKAKPAKKAAKEEGDNDSSEEDSVFGGADDDDDSSSGSEAGDGRGQLKGRARWLKRTVDPNLAAEKDKKRDAKKKRQEEAAVGKQRKEYSELPRSQKVVAASSWATELAMTEEELDKKVLDLVASRGRKNTDPRDVLRQLEVFTKVARLHGPKKEIPLLMHLISAMLDGLRSIDDFMELHQWRTCHRSLSRVLLLLQENNALVMGVIGAEEVSELALNSNLKKKLKDGEVDSDGIDQYVNGSGNAAVTAAAAVAAAAAAATASSSSINPNVVKVVGSIESFVLRLEEEYTKSLQQINPHTQEYVTRLADEAAIIEQAEAAIAYYKRVGDNSTAAVVSLLVVEHMYYTHETHAGAVRRAHAFNKAWGKFSDLHPACAGKIDLPTATTTTAAATSVAVMHPGSLLGNPTAPVLEAFDPAEKLSTFCAFIFKFGDERSKTRALLCSVYHHAMHDRYYTARDLFLISHIQDFIEKADIRTQILYNRAVVMIGLCAFRLGLFQKAHDCLSGICSGRLKELLAQGQARYSDKDPEQEKVERRRQMPYHMHINPDLLEVCHLTSAMILELPNLARKTIGGNSYVVSKQFRKYMQGYSRQVFQGPPEVTREHVMAATKALLAGEWQKAMDYLMNLEAWKLIPANGAAKAKEVLAVRVKEEAVRTFLLLNGQHYDSLSLQYICEMFTMDASTARRIISRMIFMKEISAAWEYPADILVMYKSDVTPVQSLAQSLAEKISSVLESNERILDPLVGVYGYKDDNWKSGDNAARGNKPYNDQQQQGGRRADGGGGGRGYKSYGGYRSQRPQPAAAGGRGYGGRGGRGRGSGGRGGGGGNAWGKKPYSNQHDNDGSGGGQGSGGHSSSQRGWGNSIAVN